MKTYLELLPQEILIRIFEYDDTYKNIFKNKVLVEIWKKSWFMWVSKSILPCYNTMYQFALFQWLDSRIDTCDLYPHDILVYYDDTISNYLSIIIRHKYNGQTIFIGRVYDKEKYVESTDNDDGYNEIYSDDSKFILQRIY